MRRRHETLLSEIRPVQAADGDVAQAHLDDLTKPKGSLGRLEEIAVRLHRIQNPGAATPTAVTADPARIYTVAGDHGVAAEGVSLFPQEVTRQMVLNFCAGGAGINALAAAAGIGLKVVDAGSLGGEFPEHELLLQRKIAPGTANMAEGPAMTEEQCLRALQLGVELADMADADGIRVLGTGDMGIANTTPSTALYAAYLGFAPADITGPGTGLNAESVAAKARVIDTALRVNADAVQSGDPVRILAALGGFEIATLAGLILGAARNRQAVVVDGFISTAAYTAAQAIRPEVAGYAFLSHASAEPGHRAICEKLGLRPLLDLGLRLGEGTGAAMAIFLLRSAAAVFNDMATFSGAGVTQPEM